MRLTVGTCRGKANIIGVKSESNFDGIAAILAVVSAVLSGVLAIGGSALRIANAPSSAATELQDNCVSARGTDAHHG